MEGLAKHLKKSLERVRKPQRKQRGGVNSLSTEIRANTAKLLGVSIGQVAGLTRGWRNDQLLRLYNDASAFVNPPALWWKKYKELSKIYGRRNAKTTRRVGKEGRKKDVGNPRQGTLFNDSQGKEEKETKGRKA